MPRKKSSPDPETTSNNNGQDATEVETLLDRLSDQQNAWELLDDVRAGLQLQERQRCYQQFLSLVANTPKAEQDALISQGRDVFKYQMDTARQDLKKILESSGNGGTTLVCAQVISDGVMAEAVRATAPGSPVQYLVYHQETGEVELCDRVEVGETVYLPPQSKLIETGTILLPSGLAQVLDSWSLFLEIRKFIMKYVQVESPTFRGLLASYVLMTWVYDLFDAVPYLRTQGDYGSGKTRAIQVVGSISRRGIMAGGAITAAPIFRVLERYQGTLVIDEADFNDSDSWSEITKILNCGYMRGFPVLRVERDSEGFDVRAYDCYGPKILSTRRRFADPALESRCLSMTMPLVSNLRDDIPLALGEEFRTEAQDLRNKLVMWRFHTYYEVKPDPYFRIPNVEPRVVQIIIPLLACTEDERMKSALMELIHKYQSIMAVDRRESLEGTVISALAARWFKRRNPVKVLLKEVLEQLQSDNDWAKDTTARKLSSILRKTFSMEVRPEGGLYAIFTNDKVVEGLMKRYSIQHPHPKIPKQPIKSKP